MEKKTIIRIIIRMILRTIIWINIENNLLPVTNDHFPNNILNLHEFIRTIISDRSLP